MKRYMIYATFDGEDVNIWKDGRTYKYRSYAMKVAKECARSVTDVLMIKEVTLGNCPTCNAKLRHK